MFNQSQAYPPYIERGGEQTYCPPYMNQGAKLHSFLLQANQKSLQALCDKYLNQPTRGMTHYQPVLPYVFLVFAEVEQQYSIKQPDQQRGWVAEVDVAFWILTASMKRVAGVLVPEHFAWFMPYVFVDNPFALMSGREVFGFHKALGQFTLPQSQKADFFATDTMVVDHFSPQSKATWDRLFEIRCIDSGVDHPYVQHWHTVSQAASRIGQLLAGQRGILGTTLKQMMHLLKVFNFDTSAIVFLKQFRDVSHASLACYQAIIETPIKFSTFRGGGILQGQYELILNHFDSHPIAQELGLDVGRQDVIEAFWFDFDFIVEPGTEIWTANEHPLKPIKTSQSNRHSDMSEGMNFPWILRL